MELQQLKRKSDELDLHLGGAVIFWKTIVLASDGLWDVLENQVRNLLRVNGPAVHVDRYRQAGTLKYSRLGTKCHPKSLKSTTAAVT